MVAFGAALVLTGAIAYLATGQQSVTALIPAFIGAPPVLAGLAALRPRWRSHGLYVATGLGLLLAVGTLRGVFGLLDGEVPAAAVINTVLLAATAVFLALCIRELRGRSR